MLFISMYSMEVNIALFRSSHYSVLISVMLHVPEMYQAKKVSKVLGMFNRLKKRGEVQLYLR